MADRIALVSKFFGPPGNHHQQYLKALAKVQVPGTDMLFFDQIVVRPCGPRDDDPKKNWMPAVHRATMADLAFSRIPRCRVDLDDLELPVFTRTHLLEEMYGANGNEVWHVVDTMDTRGGKDGNSKIQTTWQHGPALWERLRFVVIVRGDYDPSDLPPHSFAVQPTDEPGWYDGSRHIRDLLWKDCASFRDHVDERVAAYIDRHELYRDAHPKNPVPLQLDLRRPLVCIDKDYPTPRALELAAQLGFPTSGVDDPTAIIALGGDGQVMRVVRAFWRHHVPIFGLNAGHRGYHMNELKARRLPDALREPMKAYHLPMLRVTYTDIEGNKRTMFGYQDAWVQKDGGGVLSVKVTIDGVETFKRLMGDVALVALPVGSSGYARSLGGMILPITANVLTFAVGALSDYSDPPYHRPSGHGFESKIRFEALEMRRRPPYGFVDGVPLGPVRDLTAEVSKAAAVETAYFLDHNPHAKTS